MRLRRRDIDKRIAYNAAATVAVGGFVHGVLPTLMTFGTWILGYWLLHTCLDTLSRHGVGINLLGGLMLVGTIVVLAVPLILLTLAARGFRVSSVGLRTLADMPEQITPLEAEYCRTLAELIEQNALAGAAGRETVGALNTLLHHGRLIEEKLKELQPSPNVSEVAAPYAEEARLRIMLETETDETHRATLEQLLRLNQSRRGNRKTIKQASEKLRLRHEVIRQTFIGLRETLMRTRLVQQEALGAAFAHITVDVNGPAVQTVQEMSAQLQRQARSLEKANDELLAVRAG